MSDIELIKDFTLDYFRLDGKVAIGMVKVNIFKRRGDESPFRRGNIGIALAHKHIERG